MIFCDILSKRTYARRVRIPRYTLDEFHAVVAIACVDGTMSIIKYSFVYSFELITCAGDALKLYCKQDWKNYGYAFHCWQQVRWFIHWMSEWPSSLRWRHNGRDSVTNHQPYDCLLDCLFRCKSTKTPKLRVTGLCVGNSPVTRELTAQITGTAENISIWWRLHVSEKYANENKDHRYIVNIGVCISTYIQTRLLCSNKAYCNHVHW